MNEGAVDLHARVEGQGFPLMVLHGLLGSSANWSGQIRKLGELRETHALDLRNHGASPWTEEMDYPLMAADFLQYADRQGWKRMDVIGHSLGGKAAMWLALTRPERVGSLIVVDIAPGPLRSGNEVILDALWETEQAGPTTRKEAEALLKARLGDHRLMPFFLHGLAEREDGTLGWKSNLRTLRRCYPGMRVGFDDEWSYDGPTLFVSGQNSDFVRESDEPEIRRLFPNSRHAVVEGAGHLLHVERAGAFFLEAKEFLDKLPATAQSWPL